MRLSRYLAQCGLASRRTIDTWIEQGRIKQGNHIATLGALYQQGETITLDGKVVALQEAQESQSRVLLYHKPIGEICTRQDPQGRPTVFDRLPPLTQGRWVAVGRLDFQTSGLLIFVTDGALAHQLMHPRFAWERVYHVKVQGQPQKPILNRLIQQGVVLDGQHVAIDKLEVLQQLPKSYWVSLTLHSGVNRAVRRIFESIEQNVVKLKRVQYAHLMLPEDLKAGEYLELSERHVKGLEEMIAKGGT